jgi:hypothetical protein
MRFTTFLSIGVILLCSSILTLAALDLRFTTAISQAPDPANAGDAVTFTVSLISDGAIVNDLKLIGGVGSGQIVEKIFAGIANGGTRTQNMNWTAIAGTHTVWFELDPDHVKGDSNYGNNRVEKRITVGGGAVFEAFTPGLEAHARILKPDLVISSVRFTKDTSRDDKYFYEIKFKNQGVVCIGAFNFKMFGTNPSTGENLCATCLQGRFAAVRPLCALKAGEEKQINGFILKSNFSKSIEENCPGFLFFPKHKIYNPVYLIVDHDNRVDESNEGNNQTAVHELIWKNECD